MKNTSQASAAQTPNSLNISAKSFLAAIIILFVLMVAAYIMTFIIPGGEYQRIVENGKELIVNGSYTPTGGGISFINWVLSPFLVLGAPGNGTIIAVIIFLLVIGGIFFSLDKSGLMHYMLEKICHRFQNSKYQMLALVTLFFMAMGALAGTVGSFLTKYQATVNIISGTIVVFFGLHFLGVFQLHLFKGFSHSFDPGKKGFFSTLVFGIIFSLGWTPCVGAFLGSALMLASQQGHVVEGTLMLLAYSLGLGIPFILSAILIDYLKSAFGWIKRNYRIINVFSGSLLILIGILMATGMLGRWLSLLS